MKLSFPTLDALQALITGDPAPRDGGTPVAPYMRLRDIDSLLRTVDGLDLNVNLGTSRGTYVRAVLEAPSNRDVLASLISATLHPARFARHQDFDLADAIAYLNSCLRHDGYVVEQSGARIVVVALDEHHILTLPDHDTGAMQTTTDVVRRHLVRATARATSGDHEGAITLARAALEMLLDDLNRRLPGTYVDTKGDVKRAYSVIRKRMNLETDTAHVTAVLDILRGLTTVVGGLGELRNKMSDAHPTIYRVQHHHAVLAINAVTTVVAFMADSVKFQGLELNDVTHTPPR